MITDPSSPFGVGRRPPGFPFSVVVLDSDPAAASALLRQLGELGYSPHWARDEDDALRLAETLLPHVTLLSLRGPLAAPAGLMRSIRAVLGRDPTAVVAVVDGDPATRPVLLDAGFDALLERPVDSGRLGALMSELSSKLRQAEAGPPAGAASR